MSLRAAFGVFGSISATPLIFVVCDHLLLLTREDATLRLRCLESVMAARDQFSSHLVCASRGGATGGAAGRSRTKLPTASEDEESVGFLPSILQNNGECCATQPEAGMPGWMQGEVQLGGTCGTLCSGFAIFLHTSPKQCCGTLRESGDEQDTGGIQQC